jgi:hypothetical protein
MVLISIKNEIGLGETEHPLIYRRAYMKKYNAIDYHCKCGKVFQLGNKQRHFRTRSHQNYILRNI